MAGQRTARRGQAKGAALALLIVLGAAAGPAAAAAALAEAHNVLERFPAASLQWSFPGTVGSRGSGIKISYNTTQLKRSGDWVEVSWSGVSDPEPTDLLALFSPPDAFVAGSAPVKFANASDASNYLGSGKGRLSLRLVNLRSDMRIVFIRGADAPAVVARGPVIRNMSPNEPTGIHLMRSKSPRQLLVQFTTRNAQQPVARYGRHAGAPDYLVPTATATYGREDMCGAPATTLGFLHPGLLHTAALSGLEPGQRYYYSVGDASSGVFSPEFSFRAPPLAGPGATVHILALADQGVGEVDGSYAAMEYEPAAAVAALTVAEGRAGLPGGGEYSLVLHNGDLAYARGYSALWDAFLFQQQELAARIPYMVCIGNHERDHPGQAIPYPTIDSGGECGVPYAARFPMPTPADAASAPNDQPWYSYDHGPVHFTVMSTEHHFGEGSAQHRWLESDLAGVDRSRTPWLVLVGHRPVYIDADEFGEQGKGTTAIQLQTALEHLLDKYGVDVALSGHHHSYQRTCSVLYKECRRGSGTVHLCLGNAGADFYNNGMVPQPQWVAHEAQLTHGYARLHVNATHFHIEAVDSSSGKVFDEAVLTKRSGGSGSSSGGSSSSASAQRLSLFGQRVAQVMA